MSTNVENLILMGFLSDKELKDFSRKFVFLKWIGERTKKKKLSLKEASQIVEWFVEPEPREDLQKHITASFSETRVKLLKLCLNSQTPNGRWKKCRDSLVKRLETLVIGDNVEQSLVFDNLMDPNSFICQCIKVVVFFNATDKGVNLPEGVIIRFPPPIHLSFSNHRFERSGTTLKAYANDRENIAEKYINMSYFDVWDELDRNYKPLVSTLIDTVNDKKYLIRHNEFYEEFEKQYTDFINSFSLNPNMEPEELLKNSSLLKAPQRTFLQKVTESKIYNWKWVKPVVHWDVERVINDYFPDLQGKIKSIGLQSIRYKPDNPLLNEESLRYELADLYLEKLSLYERKEILVGLAKKKKDFSVFRLKAFRDLVDEWANNKSLNQNILNLIRQLSAHYSGVLNNPKEYARWYEYVEISKLIQQGNKPMKVYKIVAPGDKSTSVSKRYRRRREEAKQMGYNVNDPNHIQDIKRKWDIPDLIKNH